MYRIYRTGLALLTVLAGLIVSTGWAKNAKAGTPNTWTTVAPLPEGRIAPAAASANGKLFVFGGYHFGAGGPSDNDYTSFEAYDPGTNTWTSMGSMPEMLAGGVGAVSAAAGRDGRIYLYGTGQSSGTATMLVYDPHANTWVHSAPPPGVQESALLVAGLDGRIYAVGGRVNGAPVGTLSAYDPGTHSWTGLAPDPDPGNRPAAASGPDGRIYVIGGDTLLDDVEAYDPRSNTWTSAPSLPTPRAELQAVTGPDGRIYALGGEGKCFTAPCDVVEAYDTHTNTWASAAPMPRGREFFAATAGPDGRIYVLGGSTAAPGQPFDPLPTEVDAYTVVPGDRPLPTPQPGPAPATRELAPMPTGRFGLGLTSSAGKIYAIGGEEVLPPQSGAPQSPNSPVLRTVEAYDPETNAWATQPELPAQRMGMGTATGRDGRIYVLGGVAADWDSFTSSNGIAGLSTVLIYNPRTHRWSRGKPMPDGRYALAAVTGKDGRIYTIGGATTCYPGDLLTARLVPQVVRAQAPFPGGRCEGARTVRAFNPRTNTWTTLAPLPADRILPTAAVAPDGRIYVFGGDFVNGPPSPSFEVYDPRKNRWTDATGMPHVRVFGFAAATAREGQIDLIGGCSLTEVSQGGFSSSCLPPSPVDTYDPGTNTWKTIGSTLNARQELAATTGPDGQVYAVGGLGAYDSGTVLEVIQGPASPLLESHLRRAQRRTSHETRISLPGRHVGAVTAHSIRNGSYGGRDGR